MHSTLLQYGSSLQYNVQVETPVRLRVWEAKQSKERYFVSVLVEECKGNDVSYFLYFEQSNTYTERGSVSGDSRGSSEGKQGKRDVLDKHCWAVGGLKD